ncbi:nucleoside hydrolase [Elioraea tepida]|uniref:Nucleoside hydrolase n=1 Tax=Elioraea tepida TaxID=2843330 RepID=A0A975YIT4_9PROT|nr:nucleoside hydrolase [Elioraea tepida]QXM23919.1 nucleoside hydrolase [Elioraea tepida]
MVERAVHAVSTPVVIDCDPGVDDSLALLMALAAPTLSVRLVTVVAGNAPVALCAANARRVLDLAGRHDIPVIMGAAGPLGGGAVPDALVHGADGLAGLDLPTPSQPPDGSDAPAALAAAMPATVLALGPLTNLAAAIDAGLEPERLLVMGGAIGPGNMPSGAEFNVGADPIAARRVFARPVTLVPLDVARAALATPERIDAIAAAGRVGQRIAPMLAAYAEADAKANGLAGGMWPDAHAVAALLDPSLYAWRDAAIEVDGSGRTRFDWEGRGARVAVAVDAERFFALVARLVAAL